MNIAPAQSYEATVQETYLTQASEALVTRVETRQWMSSDGPVSARRMLGQLLGQAQDETPSLSNVDLYLQTHPNSLDQSVTTDMTELAGLGEAVAQAAFNVAQSDALLDRSALDANLDQVENALSASRRAKSFFDNIRTEAGLDTEPSIIRAREALTQAINEMTASADALADRRWSLYNPTIG